MTPFRRIRGLYRFLFRREQIEREIDDELRAYLDIAADENRRRGLSSEQAARAARLQLGGVEQVKEADRAARIGSGLGGVLSDLRYGCRTLRKHPWFTAVMVATLALGIGASTTVFSVVNAVLLRPLPFAESGRLVWLWSVEFRNPLKRPASYPDFMDWKAQSRTLDLIGHSAIEAVLTGSGEPQRLTAQLFIGNLFTLLGVPPALGATITAEGRERQEPLVVLSHELWRSTFNSDPNVLGRHIFLNGLSHTVTAVMPAGFQFPVRSSNPVDLWVPLERFNPALQGRRNARLIDVVGRLKSTATVAQAQAEMDVIAASLSAQHPETNKGLGVRVIPALDEVTGDYSRGLLLLVAAVAGLVLISCINVANLQLARTSWRRREIATRAALGAGRTRILRQLMIESLLIAGIGGVAGCVLAIWGVEALKALVPENLPRGNQITVDGRLLGFAALLSLVTGLGFGLAPVWHAWKLDLIGPLQENTRTGSQSPASRRLCNVLVVSEIAVAMILLSGAGLFIHSLWKLTRTDPGFDPHHVLTFEVSWPFAKHPDPVQAFTELRTRLLEIPGVTAASTGLQLPDRGHATLDHTAPLVEIEGRSIAPHERRRASLLTIQSGYFRATGIPLVEGRDFSEREITGTGMSRVTIINESLARAYFPDEDAIGKRLKLDSWVLQGGSALEIVGVAGDVKHSGMNGEVQPLVYLPLRLRPDWAQVVVLKTEGDPLLFVKPAREALRSIDPDQPIHDVQTLEQRVAQSLARDRFSALLLGLFSAFALILAAVGLYGLLSYLTAQRTREVGIRMALGAQAGDVVKEIVGQGMKLVVVGGLIGLAGAAALTQLVDSLLFEISAGDPVTLAAVTMLLVSVALLACWAPARAAARMDPIVALKHE